MRGNKASARRTSLDLRTGRRNKFKNFQATHKCRQGGNSRLVQVLRTYKSGVWEYAEVVFANGCTARVYSNQLTELHPGVPAGGDDGGIPKA